MTLSLADRSTKTSAIKILSQVGTDPDADRKYQLKKEEMELRAAMRSRVSARPKRRAGARAAQRGDDSEDEGGVSLQAIKNKYKQGQKASAGAAIYSSESDASDVETRRARRQDRAKALKDSDDEGSDDKAGGEATPARSGS
ncbi:hypothetical protein O3G_MSEX000823, partial [Manduca sexta]